MAQNGVPPHLSKIALQTLVGNLIALRTLELQQQISLNSKINDTLLKGYSDVNKQFADQLKQ